ncbi:MAG: integrase core domain-containing protein [Phycisphaerales bacterium]|nr:integrase core domain-containing protein [Phycisphaerales bacterium]
MSALRAHSIKAVRLPHRAPNLSAHVERFIQTVQIECLDRFFVMGTGHLDHLMAEYIRHYNRERPHSAIEFRPPAGAPPPPRMADSRGAVTCRTRLGGVLRHYYRAAA